MGRTAWPTRDHAKQNGIGQETTQKQLRPISLEEKHENFIPTVRKWEILAATKVKMSGSEKPKWTGIQTLFFAD